VRDPLRDAEVADQVLARFGPNPERSLSVLDVGCGTGALLDLGVVGPDEQVERLRRLADDLLIVR